MEIRTRIIKPNAKLNEGTDKYKVVMWRNGIQDGLRFVETKRQANEVIKRYKNQFKKR